MTLGSTRWASISPLLDQLLEVDPEAREARLATLRGEDAALADELASLLSQQAAVRSERFLEGNAVSPDVLLAGRAIGAYTLDRLLGRGGMGGVWLARRSDGRFEAQVAVKLLNLALLGHGGAERFHREGRMLARLSHPHIARLLDAGVAWDGQQPYLVLEYVDGEPIDRYCDAHRLGVEARVRLFIDVLGAVEFAHRNLVLHRDLKPANILVTKEGVVKLLDFGIAKLLDANADSTAPTQLTQMAGDAFTPDYAAPEQAQREAVTTATDVYALGVILYRLLSGSHPTAIVNGAPIEQLRALVETVPCPASIAAARTAPASARALRGDLDTICAKALKKSPRERYPTVTALAEDLRRHLAHEPVLARPDSRRYRIAKFVQRHRVGVGAAATTLLVLVAGVIGTTWQAIEARRERDAAVFQAERASAHRTLVELMLGAMGDADRPLTPREILNRSATMVEQQFMNDPRIAVDMLLQIAGQYLSFGDTAREYEVMQRAGAIASASGDPLLIADVACNVVETELLRNRPDLARTQLEVGRKALARVDHPGTGTVVSCAQAEADLARHLGDLDTAISRSSEAIALLEREGRTRGSGYAKFLSFLGTVQLQRGDIAASFRTVKKLQRLDDELGRSNTLDYLTGRHNEALLLTAFGEHTAARELLDDVVARWPPVTSEAIPAYILHLRGMVAYRLGDYQRAEPDIAASVALARERGALDRALRFELSLARVRIALGRFDEAERLLQGIEAASQASAAPTAPTRAVVRAELLLAQGELAAAAQLIGAELTARRMADAKDSPPLAEALLLAARVELAASRADTAATFAAQALAMSERLARDPAKSAHVGEAHLVLSLAQRGIGRSAESTESAKRAARSLASGLGADHRLTREALALVGAS